MKAPKTPTKKLRFKLPLRRKPKGQHELVLTRAADVKAERVHWLWPGRIARGSVTIIAGEPGLGKSLIAARLAATVSRGRKWPCKEGSAPGGDVILIIAEDGSADTVRPRLEAAGANLKKVHILRDVRDATTGSRPFNLLDDLERLDRAVENTETPRVVIIDPWSAFLTAVHGLKFNPNDVAQVRGLMGRLDALAKKHDVGVVLIGHPSKARSGSALSRVAGSSAFVAAARAAFVVMRGEAGSKWRVFAPAKNNLGRDVGALQFRIREQEVPSEIRAPYIVWNKNRLQITADEALTHSGSSTDRQAQQRGQENCQWIDSRQRGPNAEWALASTRGPACALPRAVPASYATTSSRRLRSVHLASAHDHSIGGTGVWPSVTLLVLLHPSF